MVVVPAPGVAAGGYHNNLADGQEVEDYNRGVGDSNVGQCEHDQDSRKDRESDQKYP